VNVLAVGAIVLAFAAGLLLTLGASRAGLVERGAIRQRVRSLADRSTATEESRPPAAMSAGRTSSLSESSWSARTALQLERAGLQLRVSEYVTLRLLAGLMSFL